jgi:hypothetical protein
MSRQSQNLDIITYDPEIKRTIRQCRDTSELENIFKVEEDMARVRVENPPERKPMKCSFIPQNQNQPSCIAFQLNVQSNFDLSPLLNMVPHYRGTPTEDPYLHI